MIIFVFFADYFVGRPLLTCSVRRASRFLLFDVSAKSKKTNFTASFATRASEYEQAVSVFQNLNDLISKSMPNSINK